VCGLREDALQCPGDAWHDPQAAGEYNFGTDEQTDTVALTWKHSNDQERVGERARFPKGRKR
jgi:hypothetical protein